MGLEIERKFLLSSSDWRSNVKSTIEIKQGYLNSDKNRTVRVRISGNSGLITIKGKTIEATRPEFEYEIPLKDAHEILKLCEKPIIEKKRYLIVYAQKTWEIDEFEGDNKGLIVAEIELNDENEAINLPDWIGEEVTTDPKYYNANLIKTPYSSWNQ